ncbi:TPA: hypothetical protein ACY4PY_004729 [Enterobacter cloacae]
MANHFSLASLNLKTKKHGTHDAPSSDPYHFSEVKDNYVTLCCFDGIHPISDITIDMCACRYDGIS